MISKKVRERREARAKRRSVSSWYRRSINARLAQLRQLRTLDMSEVRDVAGVKVTTIDFHAKIKAVRDELNALQMCVHFGKPSKKQFREACPDIVLS